MAKQTENNLSGLFAPPNDNLVGIGGVLCAYSADSEFLEHALRQFTKEVLPAARELRGSVDFTLMLNPAHPVFSAGQVPGVLQLRPKALNNRPSNFKCMHAKVALLAFGNTRADTEPTAYRLIVSTGNWTRESASNQIEMVWTLNVDEANKADRRELWVCASFLQNLMRGYQGGAPLTSKANRILETALKDGMKPSSTDEVRFMATLPAGERTAQALWPQIKKHLDGKMFNELVCGSGSFENAGDLETQPEVLLEIDVAGLLTKNATRKLVISGTSTANQVAKWHQSGGDKKHGWELCRPKDTAKHDKDKVRDKLHAKFLFLGRSHGKGMLYLGSGNLSRTGFLRAPLKGGNVEAGVLLEIDKNEQKILPVGKRWNDDLEFDDQIEEKEKESPDTPPAPIIVFEVHDRELKICWDDTVVINGHVTVVLPDARKVSVKPSQLSLDWGDAAVPQSIEIKWGDNQACRIPCINGTGEFMRQACASLPFDSWLDQLNGFPEVWDAPEVDGSDDDDDSGDAEACTEGTGGEQRKEPEKFPAYKAMLVVETIAARNETVDEKQAESWLQSLRYILIEQKPPAEMIEEWKKLKVNFLTALKSRGGFAPQWKNDETMKKYRGLIDEVAMAWGLAGKEFVKLSPGGKD